MKQTVLTSRVGKERGASCHESRLPVLPGAWQPDSATAAVIGGVSVSCVLCRVRGVHRRSTGGGNALPVWLDVQGRDSQALAAAWNQRSDGGGSVVTRGEAGRGGA